MAAAVTRIPKNRMNKRTDGAFHCRMKKHSVIFRCSALCALLFAVLSGTSCMTTYDSAGRPVQSVDPAVAVAGAAAAGLVGYAIANDNRRHHHHGYYRPHHGYRRY
jgi:hypothetical protein